MYRSIDRTELNLRGLVAALTLCSAVAAPAQLLNHQWANNVRDLDIVFEANGQFQSPDVVGVHRDPMNGEVDPTPNDMMFTFGDSVRRAVAAWNNANTGWRFHFVAAGQQPTRPCIYVRLTRDVQRQAGHVGGASDLLAWWQTGNVDMNGKLLNGYIYFNIVHDFGIGKNQADNTDDDMKFDSINVAIHELGHAIRLDHPSFNGCITRNNAGNIEAMEPMTNAGVHKLNNRPLFRRYPHAKDIARAKDTAKKMVKGKMNMQGFNGDPRNTTVTIALRVPGDPSAILEQRTVALNWDGSYQVVIDSPAGIYDVAAEGPNYLRHVRTSVEIDGDGKNDLDFDCIFGDIAQDNEINILDFAYFSMSYGSSSGDPNWIPGADLNGDDSIDIGDYSIFSQNFGMVGDD
ncbi:MAG TPA: hypothetical protein PLL78_00030 [Fimbriimonadaceae bacterium]|nr:hypothetical protein [Fimbriimonadaceae bacterium]HRJ95048.1 hypothetical protein [Fimbriimonadaceae bacterium]